MEWAKTTARWDKDHLSFGILCLILEILLYVIWLSIVVHCDILMFQYYRLCSMGPMTSMTTQYTYMNPPVMYPPYFPPQEPVMMPPPEDINGQSRDKNSHNPETSAEKTEEVSTGAKVSEEEGEGEGEGEGEECCCLCYEPAGADSGCVSDVSSGAGEATGNGDETESSQVTSSSESCDAHSDSSSQHSQSNISFTSNSDSHHSHILSIPNFSMRLSRNQGVKLNKPLKDIPPRFQKIISQNPSIRRTKFEGTPLVRHGRIHHIRSMPPQPDYISDCDSQAGSSSGSMQHNFNPHAECFVPGQRYDSAPAGGGSVEESSQLVSMGDPSCYVCPEGSECSMSCAGACNNVPTYTIHIYNSLPGGSYPSGGGTHNHACSNNSAYSAAGMPAGAPSYSGGGSQNYMYPGSPSAPPPALSACPPYLSCPPPVAPHSAAGPGYTSQPLMYSQYTPTGQY